MQPLSSLAIEKLSLKDAYQLLNSPLPPQARSKLLSRFTLESLYEEPNVRLSDLYLVMTVAHPWYLTMLSIDTKEKFKDEGGYNIRNLLWVNPGKYHRIGSYFLYRSEIGYALRNYRVDLSDFVRTAYIEYRGTLDEIFKFLVIQYEYFPDYEASTEDKRDFTVVKVETKLLDDIDWIQAPVLWQELEDEPLESSIDVSVIPELLSYQTLTRMGDDLIIKDSEDNLYVIRSPNGWKYLKLLKYGPYSSAFARIIELSSMFSHTC